jgi:hypothetical protein
MLWQVNNGAAEQSSKAPFELVSSCGLWPVDCRIIAHGIQNIKYKNTQEKRGKMN